MNIGKTAILCAGIGALLALAGCNGAAAVKDTYLATDGDLTIGIGQYKQGEYINAACDYSTGKVNITSTHITSGIPLKLDGRHLRCDPVNHKLIATVKAQQPE